MGVVIYGASDDLIEIEGDVREEFSAYDADGYIATSSGGLFRVRYEDNGTWTFRIDTPGRGNVVVEPNAGPDGDAYSDRLIIDTATDEPVVWVMYGEHVVRSDDKAGRATGGHS